MSVGDGAMAFVDAPAATVRARFRDVVLPAMGVAALAAVPAGVGNGVMLANFGEPSVYLLASLATYGGSAVQLAVLAALELVVTQRLLDDRRGEARPLGATVRAALTPGRLAMRGLTFLLTGVGFLLFLVPGLLFAGAQALAVPLMLADGLPPAKALEVSVQRMRHMAPGRLRESALARMMALLVGVWLVNGAIAGAVQVPFLLVGYVLLFRSLVEAGPEALVTMGADLGAFGVASGIGGVFGAAASGVALVWLAEAGLQLREWVDRAHHGTDLAARIAALRERTSR